MKTKLPMKTLLLILIAFGLSAKAQTAKPLGSLSALDNNIIAGRLQVDSAVKLLKYANADTCMVLSTDAVGGIVLRNKCISMSDVIALDEVLKNGDSSNRRFVVSGGSYQNQFSGLYPTSIYGVGNSIFAGTGVSIFDSSLSGRMYNYLGLPYYNYARAGFNIQWGVKDADSVINPTVGYTNALAIGMLEYGVNDFITGELASTRKLILASDAAIIVNHNLRWWNKGGSSSFNRYGSWIRNFNARSAFGGKSDSAALTSTLGDSMTFTFTDSVVVFVLGGADGSRRTYSANIAAYVDDILLDTYDLNGWNNLNNAIGGTQAAVGIAIRGLPYALHTLKLINKAADTMIVDYIGLWKDSLYTNPFLRYDIVYNNRVSDAYTDWINQGIDSTLASFGRTQFRAIHTNMSGYNRNSLQQSPDGLHPNDVGTRLIHDQAIFDLDWDQMPRAIVDIHATDSSKQYPFRIRNNYGTLFGVTSEGHTEIKGRVTIDNVPYSTSVVDTTITIVNGTLKRKSSLSIFAANFNSAYNTTIPNAVDGQLVYFKQHFLGGPSNEILAPAPMFYGGSGGIACGSPAFIPNSTFSVQDAGGGSGGFTNTCTNSNNWGGYQLFNDAGRVGALMSLGSTYAFDGYSANSIHLDNYKNNSTTTMMFWGSNPHFVVAMGTNANTDRKLDITSEKSKFLNPIQLVNMTNSQVNALSPGIGTKLFCTDCTANDGSTGVEQTWNGSAWKNSW